MEYDNEIPESVRKEFADLRDQLNAAVKRRDSAQKGTDERHKARDEIVQIQKDLKSLIRIYREPAKQAASRVRSTVAGDPLHLERPIAHSRLYGHGIRLPPEDSEPDS